MQITHNGKTYKWIGDKWGMIDIEGYSIELSVIDTVILTKKGISNSTVTGHTPEQLVQLGYMELITKPEEKPYHDKAIPEVKLYHEYKNDDWEYAITDAVNILIKAHNKKNQ